MTYLIPIKYAILIFPLIAFIFTMPFILRQYHKFGSISFFKSTITYLFIFYLICAYFLVILPLPKISEVAQLTTPRVQLIPFNFIIDFIKGTTLNINNPHTYLQALKQPCFYVVAFNIFLTMPFGLILRYYFNFDIKKTITYTFFLSLFFELTQLSGLYFIYPRGYRLFDIDDLILNTLGGLLGYLLVGPLIKIVPQIDEVNNKAKIKGQTISGLRRTVAFSLDIFILLLILLLTIIVFKDNFYLNILITFIYYFIIPLFQNTSTIGEKYLNIQILDYKDNKNIPRLIFRKLLFISIYILIPYTICTLIINLKNIYLREFIGLIIIILILLSYFITGIKYLFTNKPLLYEKLSKTKRVSTIKPD